MNREEIISRIKEKFSGQIINIIDKSEKRVYIEIEPESLVQMCKYIFNDLGARFNIASGVDTRYYMEILYHFTFDDINLLISYKVKLDKSKKLEVDSLTPLFKGADWIEREMHELLGIGFKGHPNLRKLLLSDDWPEDVYPLRCDYEEWDEEAIRDRGAE